MIGEAIVKEVTGKLVFGDGPREWCKLPYPGYLGGCPNYGKKPTCPPDVQKVGEIFDLSKPMWLIARPFDLKQHAADMLQKHSDWTPKQCRNSRYWQKRVVSYLSSSAYGFCNGYGYVNGKLERIREEGMIFTFCPEGMGVNVLATANRAGIPIRRRPDDVVYKVVLAGYPKSPRKRFSSGCVDHSNPPKPRVPPEDGEHKLRPIVEAHLKGQGYTVFHDPDKTDFFDTVAVGEDVGCIELKLKDSRKALKQASDRLRYVNWSVVLMPGRRALEHLLKVSDHRAPGKGRVGLWLWKPDGIEVIRPHEAWIPNHKQTILILKRMVECEKLGIPNKVAWGHERGPSLASLTFNTTTMYGRKFDPSQPVLDWFKKSGKPKDPLNLETLKCDKSQKSLDEWGMGLRKP